MCVAVMWQLIFFDRSQSVNLQVETLSGTMYHA